MTTVADDAGERPSIPADLRESNLPDVLAVVIEDLGLPGEV